MRRFSLFLRQCWVDQHYHLLDVSHIIHDQGSVSKSCKRNIWYKVKEFFYILLGRCPLLGQLFWFIYTVLYVVLYLQLWSCCSCCCGCLLKSCSMLPCLLLLLLLPMLLLLPLTAVAAAAVGCLAAPSAAGCTSCSAARAGPSCSTAATTAADSGQDNSMSGIYLFFSQSFFFPFIYRYRYRYSDITRAGGAMN